MTLRARDAVVVLGGREVLRGVSLAIAPGEHVCVLGPNGTGKSTLLGLLAGNLRATRGEASLSGIALDRLCRAELARRRAVMSQDSSVAFDFTGLEIARLGRTPHGRNESGATSTSVARAALAYVGAEEFAHRPVRSLSGGERQRVHLARALAQLWDAQAGAPAAGERYLLLDEPVSALDVRWQHEILSLIRRLTDRGIGVLSILHDLNLAALYADRVAFLHDGRVHAAGAPAEVMTPTHIHHVYGVCTTVCVHPTAACPLVIHSGPRSPETIAAGAGPRP